MELHLPGWAPSERVPDELCIVPCNKQAGDASPSQSIAFQHQARPPACPSGDVYPSQPIAFQHRARPPACRSGSSLSQALVHVFDFLNVCEIECAAVVAPCWRDAGYDISRYTWLRAENEFLELVLWKSRLASFLWTGRLTNLRRLELEWCAFSVDEVLTIIGLRREHLEAFSLCHSDQPLWQDGQSLDYFSGRPEAFKLMEKCETGFPAVRPCDKPITYLLGGENTLDELCAKIIRSHPAMDMNTTVIFDTGRVLSAVVGMCRNLREIRWSCAIMHRPFVVDDTMIIVTDAIKELAISCPHVQILEVSRSFGHRSDESHTQQEIEKNIFDDSLLLAISRLAALTDLTLCIDTNRFSVQGIAGLLSSLRSLVNFSLANVMANISDVLCLARTLRRLSLTSIDDGANQSWPDHVWENLCENLSALSELWVCTLWRPRGAHVSNMTVGKLSQKFPRVKIFNCCLMEDLRAADDDDDDDDDDDV